MKKIRQLLIENKNNKMADFQAKLAPTLDRKIFLGISNPKLRQIEKEYRNSDEAKAFLTELPHKYYDENVLHSVIISNLKDYDEVIEQLDKFLPYIDNWAACDVIKPKVFNKNKDDLIKHIKKWIKSKETYTCRFGVSMLMGYYLDDDFDVEHLKLVSKIQSEEYYANMMIAWYYATALAKKWDDTIVYLEEGKLNKFVHNKTIQKAIESYRISDKQKVYLRTLKKL